MERNQAQRGSSSTLWIIIGAIILVGLGGVYYSTTLQQPNQVNDDTVMTDETHPDDSMMEDSTTSDVMMKDKSDSMMDEATDTMMKDDTQVMLKYSGTVLAGSRAKVLDFNQADYEAAKKANKTILLYFYANWCPICKAEIPNFYSAFNATQSDEIVAFRVNFNDSDTDETEQALAREFGVAYQHTKVIIKNGQRVLKSPESWDQARYTREISNVIQQS